MFEEDTFGQLDPVPIEFASAVNHVGTTDTFTLRNVPVGQTVKLYQKDNDGNYIEIASKEAVTTQEDDTTVTVFFDSLDFGAEAGEIFYATAKENYLDIVKLSVSYEVEIDRTKLEAAITEAEGLNEADYTIDSWTRLKEELEAAKALGEDATQEAIETATAALTNAIKDLIEVVVDPTDPFPKPPTDGDADFSDNVNPDGSWKYDNGNGEFLSDGWGKIDNTWYFFDKEGVL